MTIDPRLNNRKRGEPELGLLPVLVEEVVEVEVVTFGKKSINDLGISLKKTSQAPF